MLSFAGRALAVVCFFSIAFPALAIEDTPQNREQEADKYLQAVLPQSMTNDLAAKFADAMPPAQRDDFKAAVAKYLDMKEVAAATRKVLVKVYTADELHALTEFYGSPAGRSAMAKTGEYMRQVMPATVQLMEAAYAKAQAEKSGKQSHAPATDAKKQ